MKHKGFTLLEILIALTIISIALTAIVKISNQTVRDTTYIRNKNISAWVAHDVMSEIQLGLLKVPSAPNQLRDTVDMLGQKWTFKTSKHATPNSRIHEIQVDVMHARSEAILFHLTGYLYDQA